MEDLYASQLVELLNKAHTGECPTAEYVQKLDEEIKRRMNKAN